jgi:hypothetical protein
MVQSDLAKWLTNTAQNAPVQFARSCALHIQKTGYLSLGEFFEHVSDMEIRSVLALVRQSIDSSNPAEAARASTAIEFLVLLLKIGAGIYTDDRQQITQYALHFCHYVVHEINDRQFVCDAVLRAKRLKYSIEIRPEERK